MRNWFSIPRFKSCDFRKIPKNQTLLIRRLDLASRRELWLLHFAMRKTRQKTVISQGASHDHYRPSSVPLVMLPAAGVLLARLTFS